MTTTLEGPVSTDAGAPKMEPSGAIETLGTHLPPDTAEKPKTTVSPQQVDALLDSVYDEPMSFADMMRKPPTPAAKPAEAAPAVKYEDEHLLETVTTDLPLGQLSDKAVLDILNNKGQSPIDVHVENRMAAEMMKKEEQEAKNKKTIAPTGSPADLKKDAGIVTQEQADDVESFIKKMGSSGQAKVEPKKPIQDNGNPGIGNEWSVQPQTVEFDADATLMPGLADKPAAKPVTESHHVAPQNLQDVMDKKEDLHKVKLSSFEHIAQDVKFVAQPEASPEVKPEPNKDALGETGVQKNKTENPPQKQENAAEGALNKEIAELKKSLEAEKAKNEALEKQNTELKQKVEAIEKNHAELEKKIDDISKVTEAAKEKVHEADRPAATKVEVRVAERKPSAEKTIDESILKPNLFFAVVNGGKDARKYFDPNTLAESSMVGMKELAEDINDLLRKLRGAKEKLAKHKRWKINPRRLMPKYGKKYAIHARHPGHAEARQDRLKIAEIEGELKDRLEKLKAAKDFVTLRKVKIGKKSEARGIYKDYKKLVKKALEA